jgi:hypothetical protein
MLGPRLGRFNEHRVGNPNHACPFNEKGVGNPIMPGPIGLADSMR